MAFNEQDCIPDPSHFEPCSPGTCGPCDQNFNQKYFSHGTTRHGVPEDRVLTPMARINGWPIELQPGQFIRNQFVEAPELSYDAQSGILNVGGRFVQIGDTQMNQRNCKGETIGPCDAVVTCSNLREQGLNSTGVVLKDPNNPLAGYTLRIAPGSLLALTANGLDINLSALCAYVKTNCTNSPAPGPNPNPDPPAPPPPPPPPPPTGNLSVSPNSTVISGTSGSGISTEQLYWSSSGCNGSSPSVSVVSGSTPSGLSVNISGATSGYITISGTPNGITSGYTQYKVTLGDCSAYFMVYYDIGQAYPADGTHIRYECRGTTRVEIVANGTGGERDGISTPNSPDCGYTPGPNPDPDPTPTEYSKTVVYNDMAPAEGGTDKSITLYFNSSTGVASASLTSGDSVFWDTIGALYARVGIGGPLFIMNVGAPGSFSASGVTLSDYNSITRVDGNKTGGV